jgi:hypothetical protein
VHKQDKVAILSTIVTKKNGGFEDCQK